MEETEDSNTSKKCNPNNSNNNHQYIAFGFHHHNTSSNNNMNQYPALLPLPPPPLPLAIPLQLSFPQNHNFRSRTHFYKPPFNQNLPLLPTPSDSKIQDISGNLNFDPFFKNPFYFSCAFSLMKEKKISFFCRKLRIGV